MSWLVWVHKKGGRREKEKIVGRPCLLATTAFFFFTGGQGLTAFPKWRPPHGPKRVVSVGAVLKASFLFIAGSWLTVDLIRLFAIGLWCILFYLGRRWLPTGLLGVWAEKNSLKP
jgi:hypothetical protein